MLNLEFRNAFDKIIFFPKKTLNKLIWLWILQTKRLRLRKFEVFFISTFLQKVELAFEEIFKINSRYGFSKLQSKVQSFPHSTRLKAMHIGRSVNLNVHYRIHKTSIGRIFYVHEHLNEFCTKNGRPVVIWYAIYYLIFVEFDFIE